MCENCKDIILRDSFYNPNDYLNCLEYIRELICADKFTLIRKTCDLNSVKDSSGHWSSDIIKHTLQCNKCGKHFVCFCDTYHGSGSFRESR